MIRLQEDWAPNGSIIYRSKVSCHVVVREAVVGIGHTPDRAYSGAMALSKPLTYFVVMLCYDVDNCP